MVGKKLRLGRKAGSILLSPVVALALLTAPTVRAMQAVCDQCPPTCPMHSAAKPQRNKPSCHNQGSMRMHHGHDGESTQGAEGSILSRPPCGHSGAIPGVAMGPMILADASTRLHLPADRYRHSQQLLRNRFNEPPTPPPPIVVS